MLPPHLQRETGNITNVIAQNKVAAQMALSKNSKGLSEMIRRKTKIPTDVAPWAFIKGYGLNLLKKGVRSGMAIEQEPYFGSRTIYYNPNLKQIKKIAHK